MSVFKLFCIVCPQYEKKHCQELKNFNTTVSIVTGISLTCVRRLEKSWKHVNERALKSFNKLKGIITPTNNHCEYRKVLASVLQSQREALFEEIRRYQRSKFQFPSDDKAQQFCMNIWSLEEHELYDASCKLEPREDQLPSD